MDRLVAIGKAAQTLGVSITTLRRWEAEGKLIPERTAGGQRRYDLAKIKPELFHTAPQDRKTIAYARVSSHDQKDDLERQKQVLELYCARQGWTFEVIADLGSGMNYHKKGLKRLLDAVIDRHIGRLVNHPQGSHAALWRGTGVRPLRGKQCRGGHPQPGREYDLRGRPGEGRAGNHPQGASLRA